MYLVRTWRHTPRGATTVSINSTHTIPTALRTSSTATARLISMIWAGQRRHCNTHHQDLSSRGRLSSLLQPRAARYCSQTCMAMQSPSGLAWLVPALQVPHLA